MIYKNDILSKDQAISIAKEFGTPVYVVSKNILKSSATNLKELVEGLPFGGSLSFAVKANPHDEVVKIFRDCGLGIDASSYNEALLALKNGVSSERISLTSQELPDEADFVELIKKGIKFNATSLHQVEMFCKNFPEHEFGVRINPGLGSGYNMRLSTGGVSAGFGIWYEYIDEIIKISKKYNANVVRVHTHIGTGTDPMEWKRALTTTLELTEKFESVHTINIGGGFKAKYMEGDHDANMSDILKTLSNELQSFKEKTGKGLKLEIEPGRLLVVHAGIILSKIIDITDTGKEGYNFIRLNTGMTEILRPAMYGAQHPLEVIPVDNEQRTEKEYVVVGHCCESSDCLTTVKGDPETIEPRLLAEAKIGDLFVVGKTGAYCYGMSAVGYNSFKSASVVFVD